jgi:uncharacterized delta-60 repeat protein
MAGLALSIAVMLAGTSSWAETWRVADDFRAVPWFSDAQPTHVVRDVAGGFLWSYPTGWGIAGADDTLCGGVIRTSADGRLDRGFRTGPDIVFSYGTAVDARDGSIYASVELAGDFAPNGKRNRRIIRLKADGTIDSTYCSPVLISGVRSMAVDPQGRLVIPDQTGVVPFESPGNGGLAGTIRLKTDGSFDETFHAPAFRSSGSADPIVGYAPPVFDNLGNMYLAGRFAQVDEHPVTNVVRLLGDGRVDTTFKTSGLNPTGVARSLVVQRDGKVVIVGRLVAYLPSGPVSTARLLSDGRVDATFTSWIAPDLQYAEADASERIVVGAGFLMPQGSPSLLRFLADGRIDPEFQAPTRADGFGVSRFALNTDGSVVIPNDLGRGAWFAGAPDWRAVRLDPQGQRDALWMAPRFQSFGSVRGGSGRDARTLWIWGGFDRVDGRDRSGLVAVEPTGRAPDGFALSGMPTTDLDWVIEPARGGDLYALIQSKYDALEVLPPSLVRLRPDGSKDTGFQPPLGLLPEFDLIGSYRLKAIGDDAILTRNDVYDVLAGAPWVVKVDRTGAIRSDFKGIARRLGRVVKSGTTIESIEVGDFQTLAVYPDGWSIATWSGEEGDLTTYRIGRFTADGSLDVVLDASAKTQVPVSGPYLEEIVTETGEYESVQSYYAPPSPFSKAVPLPNGELLIAGSFTQIGAARVNGLARLGTDGRLDTRFNEGGRGVSFQKETHELARIDDTLVDAQGRIWIAGRFDAFNELPAAGLIRLLPSGAVDPSFSTSLEYRDLGDEHPARMHFGIDDSLWVFGPYALLGEPWLNQVHRLVAGDDPMRFGSRVRWDGGRISSSVTIPAGRLAELQFSSDSRTWKTVRALTGTGREEPFEDVPPPTTTSGIYRLMRLPQPQ